MSSYYADVLLLIFRLVIVVVGFGAIIMDNLSHKDLRLIFLAYAGLVMSVVAAIFELYFAQVGNMIASELCKIAVHLFGVCFAGLFFYLTAFKAHQRMVSIEKRMRRAFGK